MYRCLLLLLLAWPAVLRAADPADAIVIITTERGVGTGFCSAMGGTNYLVTNTHVLEGARRFQFRTINRVALTGATLELANDRDLARLRLEQSPPAVLPVTTATPRHGDRITVLGNSAGADAVTKLDGQVLAIGPLVIEVDAGFVSGNSGSPILNADGTVAGIATFVTKPGTTNDWVADHTRFAQTRRFGLRLTGARWVPVTPRQLYDESCVLRDCEMFLRDAQQMMGLLRNRDPGELTAFVTLQKTATPPRYFDEQYGIAFATVCNNLRQATERAQSGVDPRSPSVQGSLRMAQTAFQQMPNLPLRKLTGARWSTDHYRQEAGKYEKIFLQWRAANQAANAP